MNAYSVGNMFKTQVGWYHEGTRMGEQLGQVLSTASLLIRTTDLPVILFLYYGIINILQTAKPKFLSINHVPDFLGENVIGYYHMGQLVRPRTHSRGHTAGKGTVGNQTDRSYNIWLSLPD